MSYFVNILTAVVVTVLVRETHGGQVPTRRLFDIQGKSNGITLRNNGECSCEGYTCGCCQRVKIDVIRLDSIVCANITYLVQDFGIEVSISIDGTIYVSATVSAKNPPPICFTIPGLEKIASACLQFHDLNLSNQYFSGCLRVAVYAVVISTNVELGCFRIRLPVDENTLRYQRRGVEDRGNAGEEKVQGKPWMAENEKEEFLRRLGHLSKMLGNGKQQNIIVVYQ